MNYRKFIIRFTDGMERCIIANGINLDLRNFRASIWVGYVYRTKDSNGIVRCHKDVDKTNVDLTKVEFIAELCEQIDSFGEIIYIYGERRVKKNEHFSCV